MKRHEENLRVIAGNLQRVDLAQLNPAVVKHWADLLLEASYDMEKLRKAIESRIAKLQALIDE